MNIDWEKRKARKSSPRDTMLHDFLKAKTPSEKRQVIKNFAPHYFIFGNTLDPRPLKENENETV
jgi:hypothetical protein